jgi:beta-galactosidase
MTDRPAVTRHPYERGFVFYAATDSADVGFYETLTREAAAAGRITPLLEAPRGVEVTSRETPDTTVYFLLNLTETRHEVSLPRPMNELVSEQERVTAVTLTPLGVAVLAQKKR